jgi:hypothetical protein
MRTLVALAGLALLLAACGEADGQPPAPADPDEPVSAPARTTEPVEPPDPAACERVAETLPGLTLADAERAARRERCAVRVIARDGEPLAVTDDYSEARINVRVEDGIVIDVDGLH